MSTQHTPAPWTVLSGDWDDAGNARYTLKGTTTVGYADARLIAAAPDLLEALKWFVENDDTNIGQEGNEFWEDGLNRGIEAIAKATGEKNE